MTKQEEVISFLEKEEGLRLKAYLCPAGVPTIGIGTIRRPTGEKIKMSDTITATQAKEWLNDHLERFVYPAVDKLQEKYKFSDGVYIALCSLAYNIGAVLDPVKSPNLHASLKSGDLNRIAIAFKRFNKVNGQVIQGLVNRRNKEVSLFMEKIA